jgi:hypothetical protein
MGVLSDLPGTDIYVGRLLQNYVDMEDALAPYYGEEAEVLDDLIASWYANAHDIAVQMNAMNPKFWPLEETEQMWVEHLDATLAEAVAHLTGDFAGEVAAYDEVHDLALEMADFFSNGVMQQFPSQFRGPLQ